VQQNAQPNLMLFEDYLLCKKYEFYTQQQEYETFVVYGFILFTQPNFMVSRYFRSVKRMKHYKQKAQKKHEIFILSGVEIFIQQKN
jgi:hypothetical protein